MIVSLIIISGVYVYQSFKNAFDTMHQPLDRKNMKENSISFAKDPFSVLLMGVDEREGDKGRSDTMIVLTINPNNHSVKMLSIPRDTRTEIVGMNKEDKINHAYAFGGIPMTINTVENFLDIPINYYVQMNMEGFKEIVDAVDGITVENDLAFTSGNFNFPKGKIHLNGEKALSYTRMRYDDPRGDFGRQARQRQLLQAIVKKSSSFSSITKSSDILTALGSNVKTNLTLRQMMALQKTYKTTNQNIKQMEITSEGTRINNIYYGLVTQKEKKRVQQELKRQLEG